MFKMSPVSTQSNDKTQLWLSHISKNELELVLKDVRDFVKKKENEAFAYKCILMLSKLVYNDKCSSPSTLFQIMEACLNAVAPKFACDQLKLLNSLFHLFRYLLKENMIQEAVWTSGFVIKLKKIKSSEWSNDEENTVIAFIHAFSKPLLSFDFSQDLKILTSTTNTASALNLWHHLSLLVLCSNKRPLSDLLCILVSLAIRCGNEDKEKTASLLVKFLQSFFSAVDSNGSSEKIELEEAVLIRVLRVCRQIVLNSISSEKFSIVKDSIPPLLDRIKCIFSCHPDQIVCIQVCEKILQFSCKSVTDANLDAKLIKDCVLLTSKWNHKSELFYSVSYFISNIFIKLKTLWSKNQINLSSSGIISIIKLILRTNKYLEGYRVEVCSEDCKLKCDETTCVQISCFPASLLMMYESQNTNSKENLVKIYRSIIEDLKTLATETSELIFRMYEASCPKFSEFFSYVLSFYSNCICGYLNASLYQNALELTKLLLQKLTRFPSSILEKHLTEKSLTKFISIICCSCYNLSQFDLALQIIAAWTIILPSRSPALFKLWTNHKNDCFSRKNTALNETVVQVLNDDFDSLKRDWNLPEYSSKDLGILLFEEIKAYCKDDLRFCEPFFSAFEGSQKIEIPIFEEAAMICNILRSLTTDCSSLKRLVGILDRVKEIEIELCKLKKKTSAKDKTKINVLLGSLIVARACCLVLKIRSQNEVEGESQSIVIERPKVVEPGIAVNPNDFCNINPEFSFLKIENQKQLFDLLNEGMKYLNVSNPKILDEISIESWALIESVADAAYLYKLYGYETMEYSAWELNFKVCCALKNDEECILAMTNLLGLRPNINSKWIAHTEALVKSLDSSKSHLEMSFTIALVKNSFMKQDYDSVRKLMSKISEQDISKHRLLYAEYFILLSQCFFDPSISTVNCALESYICLAALVKERKWQNFRDACKLNCLLFEASLNLSQNYLELMLPRETRCYLKPQLKLAQKLAVPLRLAQVLVQLTWTDIMCCNQSESLSKIQTLEEILQLNTRFSSLPIKSGTRRPKSMKFEPPNFVKHIDCDCFVCCSSTCQIVIIDTVRLQAAHSNLQLETRNFCTEFLKCAQNILEKICRRDKEVWMQLSEIKLFIQYVDYLTLTGNWEDAVKISQKISTFISSFSKFHPCHKMLKQDVFEQAQSLEYSSKVVA